MVQTCLGSSQGLPSARGAIDTRDGATASSLTLRYLFVGGFLNESEDFDLHRGHRRGAGPVLSDDGRQRRSDLPSEDVRAEDLCSGHVRPEGLRAGHLRPEDLLPQAEVQEGPHLRSEDLLRAGHVRSEGLRSGHLRSEDLRAEDLRSGRLRAGHLLPEDLLQAVASRADAGPPGCQEVLLLDLRAEDLLRSGHLRSGHLRSGRRPGCSGRPGHAGPGPARSWAQDLVSRSDPD